MLAEKDAEVANAPTITNASHLCYKTNVAHSNAEGEMLSQQGPHSNNTPQITETLSLLWKPHKIYQQASVLATSVSWLFFSPSVHIAAFPFLFPTFAISNSFCQSCLLP